MVESVAAVPQGQGGASEGGRQWIRDDQIAGRLPGVVHGEIKQDIVVRSSGLKHGLAAGDVRIKLRQIMPQAALRTKVHRGIELPSGPRRVRRRIRNAMKENMVHAREEEIISRLFNVGKRGLEMFRKPGERF